MDIGSQQARLRILFPTGGGGGLGAAASSSYRDTFLVFGGERSATGDGDDVFIWNVAEERLDLFDGGRTKMAFAGKDLTAIRVDIGRFCSAGRVLPLRPRTVIVN